MTIEIILFYFSSFIIGLVLGAMGAYITRRMWLDRQIRITQRKATRMAAEARNEAKKILDDAKRESDKVRTTVEGEHKERRVELQRQENRFSQKLESVERKLESLDQRERNLAGKQKELETVRGHLEEARDKQLEKLELISGMSTDEAKQALLTNMQSELKEENTRRIREWEAELKEDMDKKTQDILTQAIQRSASEIVAETTVSTVPLPSDEMKGRLIGREGRNIRALEQATGVDLIIDDTPEAVTLSSFDPVRREIARLTLSNLILDGRIHPARIEEMVNKTKKEVEETMYRAGEDAAYQVGVTGLRPELIKLLGRLKYRTSYGQNILDHSVETAHLAGMIASELGADVAIAKRAGLLHDLGKAVDHEVEGPHATIGADLVKQWDKSPEVVQGIGEHHLEMASTSIWGYLISAADAISSARPGARRTSLEHYLKRINALEDIASSFQGVEKSYAIQAGREVRIMVKPEEIDDLGAVQLARDIVKKVEGGLEYPGQIKVTVLRETRAVDYAK